MQLRLILKGRVEKVDLCVLRVPVSPNAASHCGHAWSTEFYYKVKRVGVHKIS
jgi:hypothetical protein